MLAYVIKSVIFLSIMYIPYMLLLRKESFFRFNRLMLICIMVLSLVLPLCNFHALSFGSNPINQQLNAVIEVGVPIASRSSLTLEGVSHPVGNTVMVINWWSLISIIYIIGMVITLLIKTVQLTLLYRNILRGVLWTEKKDGITLYCHANNIAPFSWFNIIAISEDDYNNNAMEILRHEMGHISNMHSLDILLVNVLEVVQWCNPLSWILANSLRDVHEYEADDAVLRSGVNAHQYQSLLIKKAVGSSSYAFANSFNHSLLKKRITMMLQKKSNPWMRSKALYILPVACIALSAFATPELNEQIESVVETSGVSGGKVTKVSGNPQVSSVNNAVNDTVPIVTELKVETIDIKEATNMKGDPLIVIDGKKSSKKEMEALKPADIEAIDVLKDKSGIDVYGEDGKNGVIYIKTKNANVNEIAGSGILDTCEKMPEYEGGMQGLMQYMAQNLRYPIEAQELGVTGRVIIEFIVEKDGSISEVKTVNNSAKPKKEDFATSDVTVVGYDIYKEDAKKPTFEEVDAAAKALENEAIRVVKAMPKKWTPGEQSGKKVRVRYCIPLTFRLQ